MRPVTPEGPGRDSHPGLVSLEPRVYSEIRNESEKNQSRLNGFNPAEFDARSNFLRVFIVKLGNKS